ncbi:MFS transporter [Cohnella faecalis]|uniref:MFS transporter n=1 Tax=Cohnella faecalis TaxID=2315694 RepID=A0A398CFD9_9BACL|nr:MFS transporter [Cohnella faecalis]RIE01906.1 MFS transporter [Cohnella faecalis]
MFTFVMFLIGTDTFIVSPLLPTLRAEFGIATDISGWIVSAYALGYALTALVAGPLSDRADRKKVLLVGLVGFALFTALCGTATGFASLFAYRLAAGVCAAFVSPQVWASIPQLVAPSQTLKTMGWATAGLSLAQILGIPLGSLLARDSWRLPFFGVGALCIVALIWIYTVMPAVPPRAVSAGGRVSIAQSYRMLWAAAGAPLAFSAHLLYFIGSFGSFTYLGIWLADRYALTVEQIGLFVLVYGAGNLTGSLLGARIAERWGKLAALTAALSAIGAAYLLAPYSPNAEIAAAACFFASFAGGQALPLILSSLQGLNSSLRGTISSLANAAMYVGTTAGSALSGWLYVSDGGFKTVGMLVAVSMAGALLLFRRSGIVRADRTGLKQARSSLADR